MPINPAAVKWDTAPAIDPSAVRWDAPAPVAAQGPSALTRFGRSAAGLADVAAGMFPAAIQQVAYPVLRVGMGAKEAQQRARAAAAPFEQPFGRAFGVTETPEYQAEATQRLTAFVGENMDKGADWISAQTGVPKADVENMMGSLLAGAPALRNVRVPEFVKQGVQLTTEDVGAALRKPFAPTEAELIQASREGYARGPQIDATKAAQRLGVALNPVELQPTVGPKISTMWAGERGLTNIQNANRFKINEIARNELGLDVTDNLNKTATFDKARGQVAGPYTEVAALPKITASPDALATLEALRPDRSLIGKEAAAKKLNKQIDSAIAQMSEGLSGAQLLNNISSLRKDAKVTYKRTDARPIDIELADTNMAIANQLERMIDSNIANPNLLTRFQDARTKMAKAYMYEEATDLGTGLVNPFALARMLRKDAYMTGDMADVARIASNFPEVFTMRAGREWPSVQGLGRTGVSGTAGGATGYAVAGYPGALAGSTGASFASKLLGQEYFARKIASPEYQRSLRINDPRIPMPEVQPAPIPPIPQERAVVPYQAPNELLMPGEGTYFPNFMLVNPPDIRPSMPPRGAPALPAPSAESTMNALRAEQARRGAMERSLGAQQEAAMAAAEAQAPRAPAAGGIALELDPTTGRLRPVSQGVKGATPETFRDYGSELATAADKVSAGQRFNMTAAEKVMWDKTKVDLAEVAPGFKAMSDKAIAEKMMDRQWVEQTLVKIQQKADAFEQIAARAASDKARREAMANRERMMDLAEELQTSLSRPRPTASGQQGPKTRAAKRNALAPNSENNLAP